MVVSKQLMTRGFSTLEILLAMAIALFVISAVFDISFGSEAALLNTKTNQEALALGEELLEGAQAESKEDFSLVDSVPAAANGIYTTSVVVTPSDDLLTKTVTALVTWAGGHKEPLYLSLTTLVTDPQGAAGTCTEVLVGDWTKPKLLGSADIGVNNTGTDVKVFGTKAYLTANASAAAKPDFYIIDVSDPAASLPLVGSVNTGPGLAAVALGSHYAYVANTSATAQLQVIDTSNPTVPVVVAHLDVTGAGDTAVGNSIWYADKTLYLGLTKSTGPELYVIDVTDPLVPVTKASYEINSAVNDILVAEGTAYLAVPDDPVTPAIAEQMKVLDVSNAPSGVITALSPFHPNPSTLSGEGLAISTDHKTLYLGEGGANSAHKPQFFVLNVTDPAHISVSNSKYIPTSSDVTVKAIAHKSNLAFLWTSDPAIDFQVWDLNNLGSASPYASLNTGQPPAKGFDCVKGYLYAAQKSNKALQIIGPTQS